MKELCLKLHRLDAEANNSVNPRIPENVLCCLTSTSESRIRTLNHIQKSVVEIPNVGRSKKSSLKKELRLILCRIDEPKCTNCSKHPGNSSNLSESSKPRVRSLEKTHRCPMCLKMYYTKRDLTEHILRHTNEKRYKCEICAKMFLKRDPLRRHMEKRHDPNYANRARDFECEVCQKRFSKSFGLNAHMRLHDISNKTFNCSHCSKSFFTAGDLEKHIRIHTREIPYYCSKCNRGFTNHSGRLKHQRRDHSFECSKCNLVFVKLTELKTHIGDHGEETYCKFCDSMIPVDDIQEHLLSHEGDLPFSCKVCFKQFRRKDKLNLHFTKHTSRFTCDVCKKCFISGPKLKIHKLTHTDYEKNFVCDTCEKRFGKFRGLEVHIKKWHTEPPIFTCSGCEETFQLEVEANKHAFERSPDNANETQVHAIAVKYVAARPFKCGLCKMAFSAKGDMQAHLRTHNSDRIRSHICEICQKDFVTAKALKQHAARHGTEKPYHCDAPGCRMSFKTSSDLCQHRSRIHSTPQKLHPCNFCDKEFKTNSELCVHVARHTNEKRFSCNIFNKGFYDSSELKAHVMSHSDDRPYQCTYCEKDYRKKRTLEDHIKSHIGELEKTHSCTVCGKGFTKNEYLKKHIETHSKSKSKKKSFVCHFCTKGFALLSQLQITQKSILVKSPRNVGFVQKAL